MKKILTFALLICMVMSCALSVGAVSFDLEGISLEKELGKAVTLFAFNGDDAAKFKNNAVNSSIKDADGVLITSKSADIATKLDLYKTDVFASYSDSCYMFSFKFKYTYPTTVKLSSGSSYSAGNEVMHVEFVPTGGNLNYPTVEYYTDTAKTTKTVSNITTATDGWTKVDILFNNEDDKYYLWINQYGNILNEEPLIDGCDYMQDRTQQSFRIWTDSVPEGKDANLSIKDMTVNKLSDRVLIPSVGTGGYAYEETFPASYGDYNEESEPWTTFKSTVLKEPSDPSNSEKCNAGDLAVTSSGELKITQSAGTYHNWYFSKDNNYKKASPDANKLVIQMDIKSNATTSLHLGGYAANAVRVRVTFSENDLTARLGGKDVKICDLTKSFVNTTDVVNSPYTTLTFLLEENVYSLWIGSEKVIDRKDNNGTKTANSISFVTNGAGNEVYVDNIRVFEAPADFMNVYNFMNTVTNGMNDFMTKSSEGLEVFAVNSELDASNVTVTYSDSKNYYNGTDISFPLFGDSTDVRAVISSGNYKETVSAENITIPAAYTAFSLADNKLSATARKTAGEIKIIAACYDNTTDALLKASVQENTLATDGSIDITFDGGQPENSYVKVFVWEAGTLRPLEASPVQ